MSPKIIALAVGALLLFKANAANAQARARGPVLVRGGRGGQDYVTPTSAAGALAASIVGSIFKTAARVPAGSVGQVEIAREHAAAAVKAGDPYYSTPPALPLWDSVVYGWNKPAPNIYAPGLGAAMTDYEVTVDGMAEAPFFNYEG